MKEIIQSNNWSDFKTNINGYDVTEISIPMTYGYMVGIKRIEELFGIKRRLLNEPIKKEHKDLAFALQHYLEKIGIFDRESYLITNPAIPINYTFEFDVLMNIDPSREKFDWIIESDDDFDFGYMYRLYSSTSDELPNTLRLYKKRRNQYDVIIETEINQEILTGTWYHLETDIYEDSELVYHTIRFNGEEIFDCRMYTSIHLPSILYPATLLFNIGPGSFK